MNQRIWAMTKLTYWTESNIHLFLCGFLWFFLKIELPTKIVFNFKTSNYKQNWLEFALDFDPYSAAVHYLDSIFEFSSTLLYYTLKY